MREIRHVVWATLTPATRGRVGVLVRDDTIAVSHLSGEAHPVRILRPVLTAALGDDWGEWIKDAESLHRQRACPWRVEKRVGMSGARDYRLRVLRNEEWMDAPIVASIHVSMYEKMNESIRMWQGDLPPLLAAVIRDFPPVEDGLRLQVYQPVVGDGFHEPGEDSGLQEALDGIKALEVLSE